MKIKELIRVLGSFQALYGEETEVTMNADKRDYNNPIYGFEVLHAHLDEGNGPKTIILK
jgi:hypothetical protein